MALSRFLIIIFLISSFAFQVKSENPKDDSFDIILPDIILQDVESTIEIQYKVPGDTLGVKSITINGIEKEIFSSDGKQFVHYTFGSEETIIAQTGNHEVTKNVNAIPLWLSIIPPLIAIMMALIFREVYSALFTGIFSGTLIIYFFFDASFSGFFEALYSIIDTYLLYALNDSGHLSIIMFSMIIGGMVSVISYNGGMQGIVNRLSKYANSPVTGQLVTWFMGIAIFFDDYANTLVVGNTMRPVTDKLKISREKLSYIVDSTAAPVAAIAFITTWIGAELGYIENAIGSIAEIKSTHSVYSIFLNSLQYSFYPIFTLVFIAMLVIRKREFGPMYRAEKKARIEGVNLIHLTDSNPIEKTEKMEPVPGTKAKAYNALIPVLIVVFGTITGLIITGSHACIDKLNSMNHILPDASIGTLWDNLQFLPKHPDTFMKKLGTIIGASDSYSALLWASLSGLLAALILTLTQRTMKLGQAIEAAIHGFKTMFNAMLILILAWSLAKLTQDLHTADYITGLLGDNMVPWTIPAISFILAAVVAFSTGSSWGTMAILYPLVLPAAWKVCQNAGYSYNDAMMIFSNVVSTVLAGSVFGDHCSPISDTTILSSLASECNHIDHVKTQLPYAITVGLTAIIIGTIPSAFSIPVWILYPIGFIAMWATISLLGKRLPD